ncbi:MAG: exosortase-associated EpsI family protein [Phycisphaerae bacterium]|nr:exosortase-associated EpsI family protein [Phycisphaerae bacterium]
MTQRNPTRWVSAVGLPFILVVVVLAVSAVGRVTLAKKLRWVTRKEPIFLRKPLSGMGRRVGDYRFELANTLPAEMEDSLGTDQYLDWILIDTSVKDRQDPRRHVRLFVTYYTGGPNLVPHVPDVCYQAGGYKPKQSHETRTVEMPSLSEYGGEIPIRVCTFVKTAIYNQQEVTVVYTFHANGTFAATRTGVRNATHRILDKHAYFSKVEISFGGEGCQPQTPGREESIVAAAKLLNAVLPVLLEEHWPDWEAAETSGLNQSG